MSNTYFQFKQFTIHQDKCAMKVCTDACLLGAVVAEEIGSGKIAVENILDIGCGTGLLSLMLAQKTTAEIDAVEIDSNAFIQARENIEQSAWSKNIAVFNEDILQFEKNKEYDLIISNPPFFEGDLKSNLDNKNAAKHDSALTLEQLVAVVQKHLKPAGLFAVLLPWHRMDFFTEATAKRGLLIAKKILVKQSPAHNYFRAILFFSTLPPSTQTAEIIIKDEGGNYSPRFTELLKDYYLYL